MYVTYSYRVPRHGSPAGAALDRLFLLANQETLGIEDTCMVWLLAATRLST